MNGVTLQEVALKAGVSQATASLVMNGKGTISSVVQAKVLQAAKDLGYKRRRSAPQARRNATGGAIGMLVYAEDEKAYEWFLIRKILISIEPYLWARSYHLALLPVKEAMGPEEIIARIRKANIQGLFSIHYGNERVFEAVEAHGIPVIIINNSNYQTRFDSVCADEYQGAYEGTKYLLELGHRAIAFIDYFRPDLSTQISDSYIGFSKALAEFQIDAGNMPHVSLHLHEIDEIKQKISELVSRREISAVFCLDDYLGARILSVLPDLSMRVPEDISLIAAGTLFDYTEPFIPKITTMSIDVGVFCRYAAQYMFDVLAKRHPSHQVFKIRKKLIERGSCRSTGIGGTR